MEIAPLAIVQCRIGSSRLPRKMLLPFHGRPFVWHAWDAAVRAFGTDNVVCALPASPENDELDNTLQGFGARVFRWNGPEEDLLGRFYHCAHRYRWHPSSVIVRVTPDDPWKDPALMKRVARGERWDVERGAEAFTLAMLDDAHASIKDPHLREHITLALFPVAPPKPPTIWTVDSEDDYRKAVGQ